MLRACLFAAGLSLCFAGQSLANPIVLAGTEDGNLDLLDVATGSYTVISNNGSGYEGLGYGPGGVLYGINYSDQLVQVNPSTGANTLVGNTGLGITTFAGLGNGLLYAVNYSDNLYSIDSTTGAATLVGATGLPALTFPDYDDSLAGDGTNLYFTLDTNGGIAELYTLNLTTGQATAVGSLGATGIVGAGYAGQLYGFDKNSGTIYSIDTTTGQAIAGASVSALVYGAVPLTPTTAPEPASLTLLGLGALSLAGYGCRRRTS
jgi:hypothetical protein